MENTSVDTLNHQVSVKYLNKENLVNLGENYYGATERIKTLHNKIYDKPEITTELDKYMQEQIDNGTTSRSTSKKPGRQTNYILCVTTS